MTKPREKTREELQAEIEDGKKKIRQFENRGKDAASEAIPRGTQASSTAAAVSKSRSKCSPRKGVIVNSFISHAGTSFRSSPQEIV